MNPVFLQIETFYQRLQAGDFDNPLSLAQELEKLADLAWNEIDELYQPSLRIEP
ncbi:hypothetical protein NIES2107_60890 [Nostoc carneum NIES-2107]|nr:hypothetical protein NIES2107_60890 [Nostoc carneum NIES-2107]